MPITKKEMALVLSTMGVGGLIVISFFGAGAAILNGSVIFSQTNFDQAWQFLIMFGGAAIIYFGIRAGQSNGTSGGQT